VPSCHPSLGELSVGPPAAHAVEHDVDPLVEEREPAGDVGGVTEWSFVGPHEIFEGAIRHLERPV
jgi:hypothetical protein